MRKIEKDTWYSASGAWKIFYQILEIDEHYTIDVLLYKNSNGHWKRYSTNKKLPQYVNEELVRIYNHYNNNYRFKKVMQTAE
ncbi:hypothetical protein D7X33_36315 [Butyricicoccus sp. 1XD8-22]|nr:hypothetical protein D7X33_36315 [Butyricicoccus sp. 1XD8-22]